MLQSMSHHKDIVEVDPEGHALMSAEGRDVQLLELSCCIHKQFEAWVCTEPLVVNGLAISSEVPVKERQETPPQLLSHLDITSCVLNDARTSMCAREEDTGPHSWLADPQNTDTRQACSWHKTNQKIVLLR